MSEKAPKQTAQGTAGNGNGMVLLKEACQQHQQGNIKNAEKKYRDALRENKTLIVAWRNLGALLRGEGRKDESKICTEQAIKLNSKDGGLWGNLGNVLRDLNELEKSCEAFRQGLKVEKDSISLAYGLAITLGRQKKLNDVINLLTPIIKNPLKKQIGGAELGELYLELANAHHGLGQNVEALEYWKKGFECAMGEKRLFIGLNIAQLHCSRKEFDEAELICNTLEEEFHGNANLMYANGIIAKGQNKIDRALYLFKRALDLNPCYPICLNTLGLVLRDLGRTHEAGECFKKALEHDPTFGAAMNNLGSVLKDVASYEEALIWLRRGAEQLRDNPAAYSNVLFTLFGYELEPAEQRIKEAEKYGQKFGATPFERWRDRIPNPDPNRKLNIGLISPDFCRHAVSYFIEPLLEKWSREELEITLFSCGEQIDDYSERLMKKADHWVDIKQMNDKTCLENIISHEIDILIDLAGHTAGNKLNILGQKPAPIQATYLGYYGTTGLKQIDYWITDEILHPKKYDPEDPCSETRWRLDRCYIAYRPNPKAGKVRNSPCVKNGYITFGSFNQSRKITPKTAKNWALVLSKIPNSKLLLKSKNLGEKVEQERIKELFRGQDIDPQRIELRGHINSLEEHMEAYNEIDIALDTYPYTGCTTTADAIWMGVPVLTVQGNSMVSRQASAVLAGAGMTEWICTDAEDMAKKAINLCSDTTILNQQRMSQRERVRNSALLDHRDLAQQLSKSFRKWWHEWLTKEGWPAEEKSNTWQTSKKSKENILTHISNSPSQKIHLWMGELSDNDKKYYEQRGQRFKKHEKFELWGSSIKNIEQASNNRQILWTEKKIEKEEFILWNRVYPQLSWIKLGPLAKT